MAPFSTLGGAEAVGSRRGRADGHVPAALAAAPGSICEDRRVPRVTRSADVVWQGNLARGTGSISAGSGAFAGLPYSLPTRVEAPNGATSPEELLAAAHAGCWAMSLAGELTRLGVAAERLDVTATVVLDEVEGQGHRIVRSDIDATAAAAGLTEETLAEAAGAAEAGCTFSALVRASGEVAFEARLAK
jgi:osmotically inducible protein OsmC